MYVPCVFSSASLAQQASSRPIEIILHRKAPWKGSVTLPSGLHGHVQTHVHQHIHECAWTQIYTLTQVIKHSKQTKPPMNKLIYIKLENIVICEIKIVMLSLHMWKAMVGTLDYICLTLIKGKIEFHVRPLMTWLLKNSHSKSQIKYTVFLRLIIQFPLCQKSVTKLLPRHVISVTLCQSFTCNVCPSANSHHLPRSFKVCINSLIGLITYTSKDNIICQCILLSVHISMRLQYYCYNLGTELSSQQSQKHEIVLHSSPSYSMKSNHNWGREHNKLLSLLGSVLNAGDVIFPTYPMAS